MVFTPVPVHATKLRRDTVPPQHPPSPWDEPGLWSPDEPPAPHKPAHRREAAGPSGAKLLAAGTVIALVAGAAGALAAVSLVEAPGTTSAAAGPDARSAPAISGVAGAVLPSVVSVEAGPASGSGFVISREGHILTNNHVIAEAPDDIVLTLNDGTTIDAGVLGTSPTYDLAVLEVDHPGLEPVAFGSSSGLAVGDPVLAVGSPLGLEGTVTSGILSAIDRPVIAGGIEEESYINALQTDAAINPGNSGGPLLDASGRVVGVTTAIATVNMNPGAGSIGLGFAIPIDQARRTAEQIIEDGEAVYPVMGVRLDPAFGGPGARVGTGEAAVTPDSAAELAGIAPGDVIVSLEGRPVRDADELVVALRSHQPGDEVTIVVRDETGTEREIEVRLDAAVG